MIFGVFMQTYLFFFFGCVFHILSPKYWEKGCCVSSKTFLSPADVVIMQFVFKFATSGGRSVNRFNFQINASFNYNRRLKSWPLDYGQPLSPKIQLCQIAQTKQNAKWSSGQTRIGLLNDRTWLRRVGCKVRIHANIYKWFKPQMVQSKVEWFNRETNGLRHTQIVQCNVEWFKTEVEVGRNNSAAWNIMVSHDIQLLAPKPRIHVYVGSDVMVFIFTKFQFKKWNCKPGLSWLSKH